MRRTGLLAGIAWVVLLTASAASAQTAGGYRITGKVVNAESGAPLGRAEVALLNVVQGMAQDPDDSPAPILGRRGRRAPSARSALESVTTGDDGAFAFDQLPAGKYSLRGSRRGFLSASYQEHGFYSTAVVTGAGIATEGLTLKLSPGASVSGSVIDTGGEPLEQAQVALFRLSDDGLGNIRTYRATNADDLGAYEFAHLPPGTYFVSAAARVWYARGASNFSQTSEGVIGAITPSTTNNLDVVYPRAYYADASDSDAATPIPVRGGDHLRIDLHMQAVPAVHLTYTAPANGSPDARAFSRPLSLTQSVFGNRENADSEAIAMAGSTNGAQSISTTLSVAPGDYETEIGGRMLSIRASGDVSLDPQAGTPPTEVSGRVAAAAGANLPEAVNLTLQPAAGHGGQAFSTVAYDGVFHFEQVRPGAYEIEAQTQGQPMAVVEAAASGAPLDGRVLQVGTQPVTLAATLAPASAIIYGFARTSAREHAQTSEVDGTASGAMIVLVPQHLGDHAMYRRDQSDSDGSFTLRQIAAGRYTLVAIHDGWDLEWARPEVIAHYLPGGQTVIITTSDTGVTHLDKPVIVQPR